MLIGIDPQIPPELMDCLMRMGHGDEIAVVDANYPAATSAAGTVTGAVIRLQGCSTPGAISLITALMPLDGFTDACGLRMQVDDEPENIIDVHREGIDIIETAMPEGAAVGSIERQDFYRRAATCFAVVATTEARGYGCFILRKGVIF